MKKQIAVFAEQGLMLEALLSVWDDSELLQHYTPQLFSAEDVDNTVVFRNRNSQFYDYADCHKGAYALCIVISADAEAHRILSTLNCPVIGAAQALQGLKFAYFAQQQQGIIAIADATTLALQQLLTQRINMLYATLLMPASYYGKAGVEELASQTVKLLNAQSANSKIFPQQLCFNSFPFSDTEYVELIKQQWQGIEALQDCELSCLQAPIFHGMSMQLALDFVNQEAANQQITQWQTVFANENEDDSVLSAVQLEGGLQLSGILQNKQHPQRIQVNVAFDDIQLFVKQGLISVAEFLLKHDL